MVWNRVFSLPAGGNLNDLVTEAKRGATLRIVIPKIGGRNTDFLSLYPDKTWVSTVNGVEHVYAQVTSATINIDVSKSNGAVTLSNWGHPTMPYRPYVMVFSTTGHEHRFFPGMQGLPPLTIGNMDWYVIS